MEKIKWADFITIDPELHHGDPCIKGTRIPVAMIIGSLADGMTPNAIINEFPQLDSEKIQAALAYAAQIIRQEILAPLPVLEMAYAS